MLFKIDNKLACAVAESLALPAPKEVQPNHGKRSNFLSMLGPNNTYTAKGRKVAIFIMDGFDYTTTEAMKAELYVSGVIPMIVGPRKGSVKSSSGQVAETDFTLATCRSTHFDGVFFPGATNKKDEADAAYLKSLARNGRLLHAAREAFMHLKTVGATGVAVEFLTKYALPGEVDELAAQALAGDEAVAQSGIVLAGSTGVVNTVKLPALFMGELAKHRAWERDVSSIAA